MTRRVRLGGMKLSRFNPLYFLGKYLCIKSSVFAKSVGLIPHISFVKIYHCFSGSRDRLETLMRQETRNGGTSSSDAWFAMRDVRKMVHLMKILCFNNNNLY